MVNKALALALGASLAAACGSRVLVLDENEGGSGGAPTTVGVSATSVSGTAVSGAAVSATSVSGTAVSGTAVSGTAVSTTAVSSTTAAVTTSTGGGLICAFGPTSQACTDCMQIAAAGPCAELFDACFDNPTCNDYLSCVIDCDALQSCCDSCASTFPADVVSTYHQLLSCVYCETCGAAGCPAAVPGVCPG